MSESTLKYGLHSGGFVRMRLPEIRRMIFDRYYELTGEAMDESPNSVTGQNVAVFAERIAELWELGEQIYLGAFPASAPEGAPLNYAVSFSGVKQLQPSRSRVVAFFKGAPGTQILQGSGVLGTVIAESENTTPLFRTETVVNIEKSSVIAAELALPAVIVASQTYSISINGQSYSVVAATGQTSGQVALALKNALGTIAASVNNIISINGSASFSIDWSSNITANNITSTGYLVSDQVGPVTAQANTLTRIQNPVDGWDSVFNPYDAVPGTLLESGEDLRFRYRSGVFRLGAGTTPSIYANLTQDIPGILTARVFENNKNQVDADGRPPHSVEAVVEGGDLQLIFDRLHTLKPSGIDAFGNTSGFVIGADGYKHPIAISRPETRWIWLRVSLRTTNEESIPGDMEGRATAAIVAKGNELIPGQDVLLQRIGSAAFDATTGLSRVTVTAAATSPNAPAPAASVFGADDLVIGPRQKAVFHISRVTVVP